MLAEKTSNTAPGGHELSSWPTQPGGWVKLHAKCIICGAESVFQNKGGGLCSGHMNAILSQVIIGMQARKAEVE